MKWLFPNPRRSEEQDVIATLHVAGTCQRPIDGFAEFIERRGPEVGWNGVVLYRELAGLGFTGSYQQVQRFLKPYRAKRKWWELATVRFEAYVGIPRWGFGSVNLRRMRRVGLLAEHEC